MEKTEQEKLLELIDGDPREMIDTGDMIISSLKDSLGDVSPEKIAEYSDEVEGQDGICKQTVSKKTSSTKKTVYKEKHLLKLYDIHDDMIDIFKACELNTDLSNNIINQINALSECITDIGGSIEHFEPLKHVSGLENPDMIKNVEEVIKRTIQCYNLINVIRTPCFSIDIFKLKTIFMLSI